MQKDYFLDIYKHSELWDESIKIYRDSFEAMHREDEQKILTNIKSSKYKMFSYIQESSNIKEVVGFYILDINTKLDYSICTFLAVKSSKRGVGIGSRLCLNAISYFHSNIHCSWFLVEAEDKEAKLYEKFGFKKLNLDYQIPLFDSGESIKTNLMILKQNPKIDKKSLLDIIKDIFTNGYLLSHNDKRLKEQLLKVMR